MAPAAMGNEELTSLLRSMEDRKEPLTDDRSWSAEGEWDSFMAHFVRSVSGPHVVALKIGTNWGPDDPEIVDRETERVFGLLAGVPHQGVTMARVLGKSIDPPSVALEYVEGSPMFDLVPELTVGEGASLMEASGQALGAYHQAQPVPPEIQEVESSRAAQRLVTSARRAGVSKRTAQKAGGRLLQARSYKISPNDFIVEGDGRLVMVDPPHLVKYDYVHRDVGTFVMELRRAMGGEQSGRRDGADETHHATLQDAFLSGYGAVGPGPLQAPEDRWAIALFGLIRTLGIANNRLRSRDFGSAAQAFGSSFRERLRLPRPF